jgi:hypothetical protein
MSRPGTEGELGTIRIRRIVPEDGYPRPGLRSMFIEANVVMAGETPKRGYYTADLSDADIARIQPGNQILCERVMWDNGVRVYVEQHRYVELTALDRREPNTA